MMIDNLDSMDEMTSIEREARSEVFDWKIKKAHEYGNHLDDETETLRSELMEKRKIVEDFKARIFDAVKDNPQVRMDKFHADEYKKEADQFKNENKSLMEEVAQLKKQRDDQVKNFEKVRKQFDLEKQEFAQKKSVLDTQIIKSQEFFKEKEKLEKQVKEQLDKMNKSTKNANYAESEFHKMEETYKQALNQNFTDQAKEKRKEEKQLVKELEEKSQSAERWLEESKREKIFLKSQTEQIRTLDNEKKKCLAESKIKARNSISILDKDAIEKSLFNDVDPIQSDKEQFVKKINPIPRNKVMKDYFWITCLAVKLSAGQNMDPIMSIDTEILWKKALKQKVQWMEYHDWLEREISMMGLQILYPLPQ